MKQFDVAVLGGGLLWRLTAWLLADQGCKVVCSMLVSVMVKMLLLLLLPRCWHQQLKQWMQRRWWYS